MAIPTVSERAQKVHKEAIVIDMLEGLGERGLKEGFLKSLVEAGVTASHLMIPAPSEDLAITIERLSKFYKDIESEDNTYVVHSINDIEKAKRDGKVASILGMQSPITFERNVDLIKILHMLGIRVMQLAYDYQNYLGSGCSEYIDHGLTERGKLVVQEMNKLGILIDTAHCGDKTTIDIAKTSKYPVAITHATTGALIDIPRGKSDEAIKAVAETGGVYGQIIMAVFCEKKDKMGVRPTVSDWADLIDYLVNLVGIDHVGIGSDLVPSWTKADYDYYMGKHGKSLMAPHVIPSFENKYVDGFSDIKDIIKITEELLNRGYSDDETKKLIGGNWLRLLKEVLK